jgi:cell division protein FtsI/penicillin-binding protein 2
MMVTVVEEGAIKAQVPGYKIAGKTGTAEIPIPGGYDPDGTIASFVGFGPVPEPEFVILVILNRPQTSPWGSQTATVCFQRLASQLFVLLGIPPELGYLAEAQS